MPRGWSGNQNRVIRGCGSGVYFPTQCLKQNSRRPAPLPLGAGLTTEAARWLWDTFLTILSAGWNALVG